MTIYDLAELLHTKQCRYSHIDQCTWDYDKARVGVWDQFAHLFYLNKAYRLQADTGMMTLEDIAKVVKAL